LRAIRRILVPAPDGAQFRSEAGQISEEDGPSVIYREDAHRYAR